MLQQVYALCHVCVCLFFALGGWQMLFSFKFNGGLITKSYWKIVWGLYRILGKFLNFEEVTGWEHLTK